MHLLWPHLFFLLMIQIFFKDKCLKTLHDTINDELHKIASWIKLNKLSLNIKNTNYILFRMGHKLIKNSTLCIKIDNVNIEQVDHTNFLGVIINEKLNWNDHVR